MTNEQNDKDLRDFFQNRFENESMEPPRGAWVNVKTNLPVNAPWWKIGFYYIIGGVVIIVSSFFIYKTVNTPSKKVRKEPIEQASTNSSTTSSVSNSTSKISVQIDNSNQEENKKPVLNQEEKVTSANNDQQVKKATSYQQNPSTFADSFEESALISANKQANRTDEEEKKSVVNVAQTEKLEQEEAKSALKQDKEKQNLVETAQKTDVLGTKTAENAILLDSNKLKGNEVKQDTISVKEELKVSDTTKNNAVSNALGDSIVKTILPITIKSKWTMDVYLGFGTNRRTIIGTFEGDNLLSTSLADRKFSMRNKTLGIGTAYSLNRILSIQTGINVGSSKKTTRIFEKTFVKQSTTYEFETAEGPVRMEASQVNDTEIGPDSIKVGIRFHHLTRYISIPLSLKISIPIKSVVPYFKLGVSFDMETNRRTSVDIIRPLISKTYQLKANRTNFGQSLQGLFAFGASTNNVSGVNFFLEQQLSLGLTPYIKRPAYDIKNAYFQFRFGMSYNF